MGDGFLQRWMSWLAFPPPREMTQADIDLVTRQFVDSARLMADAGFSGVELHGAHGYLIGMAPYLYYRPSIWKLTLE
jgi:2,4-dienoyl-CoA reductase-like NADH-dependent reductase (Old Yellow Enzyme family)